MTAVSVNPAAVPLAPNALLRVIQGIGGSDILIPAFQLNALVSPYDLQAPLTGASHQIADQTAVVIINPAGTIAAYTLLMPVNPYDGQQVRFTATQTVTTLTLTPSGTQTISNAPTTIGAAVTTHFDYIYNQSSNTWFLI